MNYKKLFELSIHHEYYKGGECLDLSIEPTPDCWRILAGHKLIIKNKANGLLVITSVDSDNKYLVPLDDNLKFEFLLRVKNTNFWDVTSIINSLVSNSYYRFTNQNITKVSRADLEINFEQGLDKKNPRVQNMLGIINIYNNASLQSVFTEASEFNIKFQAQKQYWQYYIVTDTQSNDYELLIEDKEVSRNQKIKFTTVEVDAQDKVLANINQKFSGAKKIIFKSESEILCQEVGRRNIQLLKKNRNGSSIVLIEHLPNPPNLNGVQVINILKSI